MSKKSIKFLIVDTLENLPAKDLKKFKQMLCERDQEPRFSRRSVEDADEMDLSDLLVRACTESKAAELTIDSLNVLGCKNEADKLAAQGKIASTRKRLPCF